MSESTSCCFLILLLRFSLIRVQSVRIFFAFHLILNLMRLLYCLVRRINIGHKKLLTVAKSWSEKTDVSSALHPQIELVKSQILSAFETICILILLYEMFCCCAENSLHYSLFLVQIHSSLLIMEVQCKYNQESDLKLSPITFNNELCLNFLTIIVMTIVIFISFFKRREPGIMGCVILVST